MTGYVIAVIGDTHIGSSTALSPLQFTIHNRATLEEQITYANRLQEGRVGLLAHRTRKPPASAGGSSQLMLSQSNND